MTEQALQRIRVVLCMGQYCNLDRRAARLLPVLESLVAEYSQQHPQVTIKIETASCLSMCGAGPNCIVYPGAHIINGATPAKLEELAAKGFYRES